MTQQAPEAEPRRFLLRPAGVLTQLCSAACLLLGTIAFVLIQQNKSGGAALGILWALGAMAGLVFGGLMSRGGLVSLAISAVLDLTFGIVLIAIDYDSLRSILRVLPESDVEMIGNILVGGAVVMIATGVLCLASIGQARRYARAYLLAVEEAVAADPSLAQSFSAMRTIPPVAPTVPGGGPPQAYPTFGPAMPGGGTLPKPAAVISPAGPTPIPRGPRTAPGFGPNAPTVPGGSPAVADDRPTDPIGRPIIPRGPRTAPGVAPGIALFPHATVDAQPTDEAPTDPTTPVVPSAADTNRGWTPARTGFTTQIIIRPPQEEARSRRRIYIALGGFAIGVGAGIGVLVSSGAKQTGAQDGSAEVGSAVASGSQAKPSTTSTTSPAVPIASSSSPTAGSDTGSAEGSAATTPPPPIRSLLSAQRDAIVKGDAKAYAATLAPDAFAFGVDGEDIAEGRAAIEAVIGKQLTDPPAGGFPVDSKFLATGGTGDIAWTAEDLEIGVRRYTITEVAQLVNGQWTVVALCWGQPVADATAERMAILGTLPRGGIVPNKHDGADELDKAVRIAFSSREAFAAARSEREDGFNFGSGPGERVVGGVAIKRLFGRLRSRLELEGNVRAQLVSPTVGWAALNAVYTQKSRAATDVSQTFRVMTVLVKEDGAWKIVQTQFSNAGPIRE